MEFLKAVLGEELYAQVSEKLKTADGIELVNAKDGSYVPISKFNDERQQGKQYKSQLDDMNRQLETLKQQAAGAVGMQEQISALQEQIKTKDTEIQRVAFEGKLRDAIRGFKVHDPSDVLPHLKLELIKDEGGKIVGLEEQIKPLRESKAYLFADNPAPRGGAYNPGTQTTATGNTNADVNRALRNASGRQ